MARAAELRSTTALVALLEALQEVKRRHSVDDRTAQDIIREAYRPGDLRFVIRRPGGSFEHFDPRRCPMLFDDDECFDNGGIIRDVPYAVKGRRGMPGSEDCRIYVTKESLDAFLEITPPAPAADVARAPETRPEEQPPVEGEHTRWQRDPVIMMLKKVYAPDGIPPKGISIPRATKRINKELEFQVSEDTVGRAIKDIKADLEK
jgi:hypothetical protein